MADDAQTPQPTFNLVGQYIRDMSFENPGAPGSVTQVRDSAQRAFAGRVHQHASLGRTPRELTSFHTRSGEDDDVGLDGRHLDPRDAA